MKSMVMAALMSALLPAAVMADEGSMVDGQVVAASVASEGNWMFGNILILTTEGKFAFVSLLTKPYAALPALTPTGVNRATAVLQVAVLIAGSDKWKIGLKGLYKTGVSFWYVFHHGSSMHFGA